ncbi:uncharacterized protein N7473_001068 [Penicillium subrubescens]|uniref:uncharacterized protein n=1 Tax=Penicillium subrubescens TaxID=1316194 RepID=UPI00254539E8|nr:uncharacterized protein N7473_001068 [Penicillium subrubescens]KAJ5911765.1 hypothetical protein N7473_001068 [Penicillium subrubescens]
MKQITMATLTPTPRITLSPPNHHASKSPNPKNKAPSIDFLTGTWHVTHSSLPLWKDKRNVKITYTPIPTNTTTNNAAGGDLTKLDDLVQYQSRNPSNPKIHTVHGVDTPSQSNPGAWDWRGKGWLLIASSNWEVLGFGYEPKTGTVTEGEEELGNAWVVTYFAKTLFTPAGIDVYSRGKEGVRGIFWRGLWELCGN